MPCYPDFCTSKYTCEIHRKDTMSEKNEGIAIGGLNDKPNMV